MLTYTLKNGVVVSSAERVRPGDVGVCGERLSGAGAPLAVDLQGASMVYPALINTHDHLRGNYLPRVGPKAGTFYLSWLPWDKDLKDSPTYQERSNLTVEDLYIFGAYKNLFSGVTTVNDHFPPALNRNILPRLPIRALFNYGIAHESSSYDLKWGDGIQKEHQRAVKNQWPFITHLSEGFDEESMRGVEHLERLGALDKHCLLIHCLAFSDEDIQKVAKAGASVSWCSASNMFMFNITCKIRKFIQAGINVSIGTDSTHTGSYNLLAEMRYARGLYQKLYGEELPAKRIFQMVTENAARSFWLDQYLGTLDRGKIADLLVIKAKMDDPFENLAAATMGDIELLIMAGKPLYGEMRFIGILGGSLPAGYTKITVNGAPRFIIGNPAAHYIQARKKIGFKKVLDFLPFEPETEEG